MKPERSRNEVKVLSRRKRRLGIGIEEKEAGRLNQYSPSINEALGFQSKH